MGLPRIEAAFPRQWPVAFTVKVSFARSTDHTWPIGGAGLRYPATQRARYGFEFAERSY